jgi:hypothetical protein
MAKKIEFIFDLNSEDVKIATDRTLTLKQEIRLMSNELANIPAGTKQFEIMSKKVNELKDKQADLNVRSKEFFGVMSALPGPLGMVGGQLDNNIDLMKTFTSLSPKDLSSKFKALMGDVKDIGKGLLDLTGITKLYTITNEFLAKSFVKVGIGEEAAAAGARAFSAALIATGIGALVVALGLLIANWDKVVDSMKNATIQSKAYEEAQSKVTADVKEFQLKLKDAHHALIQAKDGVISKKEALEKWNKTMGESLGYASSLEEAERLERENAPKQIQIVKLKAQAQVMYAKAAEASAKLISGEGLEIGFWEGAMEIVEHFGDVSAIAVHKVTDFHKENKKISKDLFTEGDKLMTQAEDINKTMTKGTGKRPGEKDTKTDTKEDPAVKAKRDALEAINKAEEDSFLLTVNAREKELYVQGKKYLELTLLANKFNLDKTGLIEANRIAELDINKKYDKLDEEDRKKTLEKNTQFIKYLSGLSVKQRSDELQSRMEGLKRANQMIDDDYALDLERNKERLTLLTQQEATELSNLNLTEDGKSQIRQKFRDQRSALLQEDVELEKKVAQQKIDILKQYADYVGQIGSIIGMFAGKNVELQKLAILLEKGAAIAKIIIQTAADIGKVRMASEAAGWLVGGPVLNPLGYAANVSAGIASAGKIKLSSALAIGTLAAQGVAQFIGINESQGGGTAAPDANAINTSKANYGDGGMIYGPRHAGGGVMINAEGGEAVMTRNSVTMFAPLLSAMNVMGGGTAFSKGAVGQASYDNPKSTSQESTILKTYVVEQELTTSQHKQARLKDLSTL